MPRRTSAPKRATTTTLAPSTVHVRLEGLEGQHQRLLTQIKKKRTELNNFVEQMRSIATQIYQRTTPKFQKINALDEEIHALFNEILTKKKLAKQTRHKIEQIYRNLQLAGIISQKVDDDDEDIEFDELFEPHEEEKEIPHEYRQQQPEIESPSAARTEESKKIRSYFLRLAEIFHPDKATDSETQMRHTEIMKEINKAYQEGDLARLLEIEKKHEVGEIIDSNSEDDLTRKCNRLEQQNEFLKNQYETLKKELRSFKNTPEGAMVSECKKVKKKGFDPIDEISLKIESQIKIISEIRDYVKDFNSAKMTIKEFLEGPAVLSSLNQSMIEDFLDQMLEEMGE
ncbi:J domain-containing protein [Scytonema hofmannii FACHB-248]|uniref:J domain-containing protein n=1 Tax=Scytonema hofmannii FACHB-248 TaxID=1842502 RepID=A0ABR8GJE9_9CYAN|nr:MULTISPECIES: J domain-containing protein [Nostocales]MBD2603293.1 J domain-containing protein [Scytonema hofmannii FACHB-248]